MPSTQQKSSGYPEEEAVCSALLLASSSKKDSSPARLASSSEKDSSRKSAKKPSERLPEGISKNSKNSQISNNKTERMIVTPRKGRGEREITPKKVRAVMYLQQDLAAQRLGISVSVLKKACRNFQLGPWPRKFPELFLSAPVVKQIEAQQMTFAAELMRSSVQKQTPESLSGGM